jgi:hypothetical protein
MLMIRFMAAWGLLAMAATARADDPLGVREYAAAIVELTTPRWEGQVVPWPDPTPRPAAGAHVLRSDRWPMSVHLGSEVPVAYGEAALAALEAARDHLAHAGWPEPYPDGGLGGTGDFDLYLEPLEAGLVEAFADAPVPWSQYDAVTTFAVLDPATPEYALAPCVAAAYAQAALYGQDPAEARAWRQASGAYASWLVTGEVGCTDAAAEQQRHPHLAWVREDDVPASGSGAGLLLAMLSERYDDGDRVLVRDLWQLARQRSTGTPHLRGTPDVWQALDLLLDGAGLGTEQVLADAGVDRFFSGERAGHAPLAVLRALGPGATVPVAWRTRWPKLPARSAPADPPLEPTGSAYALVDVADAADEAILRVWLRGEYGVRWSLVAVRLSAEGRELSRMTAPERTQIPHSYLPVQLTADTAQVLVVVTNLSSRLPDADLPDENVRSFQLTVDRGGAEDALGASP